MDVFSIYITVFFFVFLIFPSIFFCMKLVIWCHSEYCKRPAPTNASRRNDANRTTVYTITADPLTEDQRGFPDFFWNVTPQTSRSRDAIQKDDKDLPSYEEVMQMEMRQQVVGLPATVAALPATPAVSTNESTFTTTNECVAPVSTVPIVATATATV